jgi:catechol 2,3-dioxygenase-like lactoylglutathione lyase family enzyme
MISGAIATVFVKDMDRAVDFYTETLGLKLQYRADSHWAQIDAGGGFSIGLHPPSEKSPAPGTRGAISIGLNVVGDIEDVVTALKGKGVEFHGPIVDDTQVRLAFFADPDGNDLYLCQVMQHAH